jgi:hypothetical protein
MSPNTKTKVNRLRHFQLVLRLLQLFATLGLLFCIITIDKTSGLVACAIRLGPIISCFHTLYAVYQLYRPAASRPAASTASHICLAVTIDIILLALLVSSAVLAHVEHWGTLFKTEIAAHKIIYSFSLICVVDAILIAVSLGIGIHFMILLRKIAKVESNLTERPHPLTKCERAENDMKDTASLPSVAASHCRSTSAASNVSTVPSKSQHCWLSLADFGEGAWL